jgi:hypothetical protein
LFGRPGLVARATDTAWRLAIDTFKAFQGLGYAFLFGLAPLALEGFIAEVYGDSLRPAADWPARWAFGFKVLLMLICACGLCD